MPDPISTVVIKGTGPGGTTPIPDGLLVKTPDHHPNIAVTVISPFAALAIRFANAYITTLVGLLSVGMTTNIIPAADFLDLLWKCAGASLAGPAVSLLKDLITVLGRLENKYPLITGNV